MPTGTASRSAPPPAPGRTPPEPLPPVQTKGQSSSARRAVCPGLFLLPIFPPARPAGSAARHALGVVGGRPGEKLESTRGALNTVHGYCAHHLHREGSAPPAPHQMTTPAADRHQQHRQRRTDDPAAHKLHSLHTLPDLTAASSPPPAPTDTAPRQPCRPPAAADHPANSQKPHTAARRRRGQILYLTGIWPLQYSQ